MSNLANSSSNASLPTAKQQRSANEIPASAQRMFNVALNMRRMAAQGRTLTATYRAR